jgi:predicted dehydrogenase
MDMKAIISILGIFLVTEAWLIRAAETNPAPVNIAIHGLPHDHVHSFLPSALMHDDVRLVGIVESNRDLVERFAGLYQLDTNFFFPTLGSLLAQTNVQAVAVFTSTYDHGRVVEECASRGIHVMMEKPLAVSLERARTMKATADKAGIHLIVNYETTWYPGNHAAYDKVWREKVIGGIRKIVVHDGHEGPKEIGCSEPFLEWLTDPVQSGGGALMDFGCYGANLITWLMQGERPASVFAVTQQFKPEIYPKVDDEATIVLTYPMAQGIIQASWNWPYSRKDMEIYGTAGHVLVPRSDVVRTLLSDGSEAEFTPRNLTGTESNPLSYLAAVVRGTVKPSGLSSLEVNMIVMEILEAARESARSGKRIDLPPTR